jgi:hypothetical protein
MAYAGTSNAHPIVYQDQPLHQLHNWSAKPWLSDSNGPPAAIHLFKQLTAGSGTAQTYPGLYRDVNYTQSVIQASDGYIEQIPDNQKLNYASSSASAMSSNDASANLGPLFGYFHDSQYASKMTHPQAHAFSSLPHRNVSDGQMLSAQQQIQYQFSRNGGPPLNGDIQGLQLHTTTTHCTYTQPEERYYRSPLGYPSFSTAQSTSAQNTTDHARHVSNLQPHADVPRNPSGIANFAPVPNFSESQVQHPYQTEYGLRMDSTAADMTEDLSGIPTRRPPEAWPMTVPRAPLPTHSLQQETTPPQSTSISMMAPLEGPRMGKTQRRRVVRATKRKGRDNRKIAHEDEVMDSGEEAQSRLKGKEV